MTILRYLRTTLGQVATKEGCASGDCGACTVMVGDFVDGQWRYQAINSCISLLASLQGRHLVTVEGLADTANPNRLHPVQQALVDYHGSQCGFCTPGFVMSLVAADENAGHQALAENQVLDAISGNLCRCTGYRPIVDAALGCHELGKNAARFYNAELPTTQESWANLSAEHSACVFPETEQQLLDALASFPDARLVAGGTDLLLEQTQNFTDLPYLIGLSRITELQQLDIAAGTAKVGAAVTLSALEQAMQQACPAFAELLHRVGSRQIRNQGTLAGNVANASPIGDSPPVLLALNASLELASAAGSRVIAVNDFFVDYKKTLLAKGEYIRQIKFELPGDDIYLRCYKVSKRFEDDISAVLLVVRWQIIQGVFSDVRIALGGMAAVPKRAMAAESILEHGPAESATIEQAVNALAQEFTPLSDVRASSHYRLTVAQNLLRKAWLECEQGGAAITVWQPEAERFVSQRFGGKDA